MTPITRRGVIAFGASSLATLAGCQGQETVTDPDPESLFEDISFDGTDMVVQLRNDHDIDRVNLISPDGSLFTSSGVPVGVTTVRLQVLDPDAGDPIHYTPGLNTLVAVSQDEEIERFQQDIAPDIQITSISQQDGDHETAAGQLDITVENSGAGPTWIHHVTYEGAPNFAANDELTDSYGVLLISGLDTRLDAVIAAGESKTYAGNSPPLIFPEDGTISSDCSGTVDLTVIVGIATGQAVSVDISIEAGGDYRIVNSFNSFTCSNITISRDGGQE